MSFIHVDKQLLNMEVLKSGSTDSEISIGDRSPCASLSTPNFRIVSTLAAPPLDTSASVGNIPSSG